MCFIQQRKDTIHSNELCTCNAGKLQFLVQLLLRLREEGHRTLIFSMSRKMLNIIQRILINHKFKVFLPFRRTIVFFGGGFGPPGI